MIFFKHIHDFLFLNFKLMASIILRSSIVNCFKKLLFPNCPLMLWSGLLSGLSETDGPVIISTNTAWIVTYVQTSFALTGVSSTSATMNLMLPLLKLSLCLNIAVYVLKTWFLPHFSCVVEWDAGCSLVSWNKIPRFNNAITYSHPTHVYIVSQINHCKYQIWYIRPSNFHCT